MASGAPELHHPHPWTQWPQVPPRQTLRPSPEMALRLDLCPSGESKGQLVSEARNKRGHPIPVVSGLASQPRSQRGFRYAKASELGRLSIGRGGLPLLDDLLAARRRIDKV